MGVYEQKLNFKKNCGETLFHNGTELLLLATRSKFGLNKSKYLNHTWIS